MAKSIFKRTKNTNSLISDSDVFIDKTLYPPHVIDGDDFSINSNDPLLLGAIASKTIGGVTTLFIYQGLDVNEDEVWIQVGQDAVLPPDISLWDGSSIGINKYVSHVVNGIEYIFRSLIDANTSEPTLDSVGAWIQTDIFGIISTWVSFVGYSIGDLVTGDSNTNVYRSKVDSNVGVNPNGGANPDEWELVGAYIGFYYESTFNLGDVVVNADESNRVYISAISSNDQPLTNIVSSSWQVVGVVISDDEVSSTKTWSSQKISDAIASASVVSSKGSFPSTDTGQSAINIPHGLDGTPAWFSIQGANVISTGVINKSDLTIDSTNIIITPEFMNNDGSTLNFLWKAEL